MILTVKQLYSIANKMYKNIEIINEFNSFKGRICNDNLSEFVILSLHNAGGFQDLFKEGEMGDELHLHVKNGRIYYYVTNMWDMYTSESFPITDEILKKFHLKDIGVEYISKFL